MTHKEKNQIYIDALEKWGPDAQWGMVHEECLELAMAIHKFRRAKDQNKGMADIIDEIADVMIMMDQIPYLINDMDKVQERIDFKLERLKKKLYKTKQV